ncbi:MAG: hypothetical protein K1Y36_15840 [Blastocatellia bacterium]|nr:hypothetical protein [Blastocatellia bacterium]
MKITYQSPPARCEICHQSDCFDPLRNTCSRCATVTPPRPRPDASAAFKKRSDRPSGRSTRIAEIAIILSVLGVMSAIAIPNLVGKRRISFSEQSARKKMRQIFQTQADFQKTTGQGGFATKWSQLCPQHFYLPGSTKDPDVCGGTFMFDKARQQENRVEAEMVSEHGYYFGPIKTQTSNGKATKFSVVGYPCFESYLSRCGSDCFFIDETGILRHSGEPNVMPDANSPPLQ